MYRMVEVDGSLAAEVLHNLNALEPRFPALTQDHLEDGWWWLLKTTDGVLCGFAGLVEMLPFPGVGYCKRAYVSPDHRGHNLHLKMLEARIAKAHELGWHLLVSETMNLYAARNFERAGFQKCSPEQTWGEPGSMYFSKLLTTAA